VLISGIDVNGPISTTSRSDVNILMTVNPLTHKILLTTTPRDYYVYIPEISGDMRDKLTHAGIYGVKTSMRTLEELYGIKISDYVRINFDSLINLVDALGGVDVDSEYDFESYGFQFHKGINHLDGEQALAFSRERYAFSSGDNQRGQNQMLVLTAILDKLQSPALLKNPSGVLEVMGSSMQTSFTTDQITELISWQLDNGQGWEIERQAVTGTGDSQQTFSMKGTDLYVMWPDEEAVSEAAAKIAETMAN
jgi:LCP family protein required for cell wall assembly